MVSEKMQQELNKQVNEEFYSSYLYLAMSAHLNNAGLLGFSNWMRIQAEEELFHAMKFYDYLLERGAKVVLDKVEQPKLSDGGILSIFEETLKHEKHITSRINHLLSLATDEKDFATQSFLKWFIDEQVEEESNVDTMIQKLKLVGENGSAIFFLDQEAATRVFVPPAP